VKAESLNVVQDQSLQVASHTHAWSGSHYPCLNFGAGENRQMFVFWFAK